MIKEIDPQEAYDLIKEGVMLVDVREEEEFELESIEGAELVPLSRFSPEDISSDIGIIFYCRSGGRSGRACHMMQDYDSSLSIYNLAGGIMAWRAAGLPVKKEEEHLD